MTSLTYSERCDLAATAQGLDPVVDLLDEEGLGHVVLNTGGFCMAVVVDGPDTGAIVVTSFNNAGGSYAVGSYVGSGWEDGEDPYQFAEEIPLSEVLSTVLAYGFALPEPVI